MENHSRFKMKKILIFVLSLICVFSATAFVGCKKAQIGLSDTSAEVYVGATYEVKASNADGATWTSDDETVATVSASGVITAVKGGSAVITVSKGKEKLTFTITVKTPSITLSSEFATVQTGDTLNLKATANPENSSVVWASDRQDIATVENGVVTAKLPGTTKITATITVNGIEYKSICEVTVSQLVYKPVINESIFNQVYYQGAGEIDLSYVNTNEKIVNFKYTVTAEKEVYGKNIPTELIDNKLSMANAGKYKIKYVFTGDNMLATEVEKFIIINESNRYGLISTLQNGDLSGVIAKNWFSEMSYDQAKNAVKLVQQPTDWEPASVSFDIYKLLDSGVSEITLDVFYETKKADLNEASISYGLNKLAEDGTLTKNYTFTKTRFATNEWVTLSFKIADILAKTEEGVAYDCVRIGLNTCLEAQEEDDINAVLYFKNLGFGYGGISVLKGEHNVGELPELFNYYGVDDFSAEITSIVSGENADTLSGKTFTVAPGQYTIRYRVTGKGISENEYSISLTVNDFRAKYDYGTINALGDNISISLSSVMPLNSNLKVAEIGGRNAMEVSKVSGNYGVCLDDFDILSHRNKIKSISYDIYALSDVNVENGWSGDISWNVIARKWAVKANEWTTITVNLDSLYGIKFGGWGDHQTDNSRIENIQIRLQGDDANVEKFYLSNFKVNFDYIGAVNGTDLALPSLGIENFAFEVTDVTSSDGTSVLTDVKNNVLSGVATGLYNVKYKLTGKDLKTEEFVLPVKVGSSTDGKFINFNDEFAADRVVKFTHDSGVIDKEKVSFETWSQGYPGNTEYTKLKITNNNAWDGTAGLGVAIGLPYGRLLDRDFEYSKITINLYVSVDDRAAMEARLGFFKDYSDNWNGAIWRSIEKNAWTTLEFTKEEIQALGYNVYCYDSLRLHIRDANGYTNEIYIRDISIA